MLYVLLSIFLICACVLVAHSRTFADANIKFNVVRHNRNITFATEFHGLIYPRSYCRCYLAMGKIPDSEVDLAEVILNEIGLLLGWYYADRAPGQPTSIENGYVSAGDGFKGTSRLLFQQDSVLRMKFSAVSRGADAENVVFNIDVSGNFPDITQQSTPSNIITPTSNTNSFTSSTSFNQTDLFAQFIPNDQYVYNVLPGKEVSIMNNYVNLNGTDTSYQTIRFMFHSQCSAQWRPNGLRVRSTDTYRRFTHDQDRQIIQSATTFDLVNTSCKKQLNL